jgi:hypothetical protein
MTATNAERNTAILISIGTINTASKCAVCRSAKLGYGAELVLTLGSETSGGRDIALEHERLWRLSRTGKLRCLILTIYGIVNVGVDEALALC